MNQLEGLIKKAVKFVEVTSTGFHTLKCPICKDHTVRAGFYFDTDHIGYNCFRGKCDAKTKYVFEEAMPKKFKALMRAIGVRIPPELLLSGNRRVERIDSSLFTAHNYVPTRKHTDWMPYHIFEHKLGSSGCGRIHDHCSAYLNDRGVELDDRFGIGIDGKIRGMLIIPFYLYGNLIGYQAVNPLNGKYFTYTGGNSHLIYSPLGYIPDEPLVSEGVFDAMATPNGVAVLGNTVSKEQAYHLRFSNPILLPDRTDSNFFAIAKEYKWRICIPEWSYKDADDANRHLGRLVVAHILREKTQDNIKKAEVRYRLWKK